jgi:adenine-specific DNA methylase
MWYDDLLPITEPVAADRQGARRHYGVHPYFTRRPYNVVRTYIQHFTKEGDTVLDPFGGSGVVPIEAVLEGRNGIQSDVNPFANFIANGVMQLSRGKVEALAAELERLKSKCTAELTNIESGGTIEIAADFQNLASQRLPKNADVNTVRDLFNTRQFSTVAILRKHILEISDRHARSALLLAWSAALPKLTRTFLSAEGRAESRGGSSIFSIYRYKVATNPIELPGWKTFEERARNVIEAKREIDQLVSYRRSLRKSLGKFRALNCDVMELPGHLKERVDFIFTDPPYGGHIAYLDLSVMWTALLGLPLPAKAKGQEIIVGGDEEHPESTYTNRLAGSIKVCLDLLKPSRWFSVVFQHWNVRYLAAILDAAAMGGAELRAAVSQMGDPIWSMHKKKNAELVLSGEFIITFQKTAHRQTQLSFARSSFDLERELSLALEEETRKGRVFGEAILNRLVIRAWRANAIDKLAIRKTDLSALLESRGWTYHESQHFWTKTSDLRQARMF